MTEYFDIVDEAGQPTGEIISRDEAHQKGTLHRTAHVWLVKKKPGGYDVLLQKRSEEKDSFPGMYDTSTTLSDRFKIMWLFRDRSLLIRQ